MTQELQRIWETIVRTITLYNFKDLLDMIIIAVVIYKLLELARETRAMPVLKGLGFILIAARLAEMIGLQAVAWMLNYIISAGAIVMVIVFQPELRRALEQLGKKRYFSKAAGGLLQNNEERADLAWVGEEIIRALLDLSKNRVGALIVIERKQPLEDIIHTGTRLEALVSQPLLENLFVDGSPLHDGAVVIRDDRIVAAGCFLPLTPQDGLDRSLGTRHRAAVGVSEVCDAQVFVVSEETGIISIAHEGKLMRSQDIKTLRARMEEIFGRPAPQVSLSEWFKRRTRHE
nr:diadenylate cyclase CdaA [bacterium]